MSTAEHLHTMEAFLDNLQNVNDEVETSVWHETILQERKAKISSGAAKFISLAELKRSLIFP